jgi:hypothetical protein
MKQAVIIVLFLALHSSCITQKQNESVPASGDYNKTKNVTFYTIYPHGSIMIPGEWTKTKYSEETSRQFFRRNSDSTVIGLGKNQKHTFSCYKKGMSDYEVVVAFYKWDSEYYEHKGDSVDLIKRDEQKEYILWKAAENTKTNTFLYGAKHGYIFNFVIEGDRSTELADADFLIKLFRNN